MKQNYIFKLRPVCPHCTRRFDEENNSVKVNGKPVACVDDAGADGLGILVAHLDEPYILSQIDPSVTCNACGGELRYEAKEELTPYQKMQKRHEDDKIRSALREKIAHEQGYIMAQISPRRYMVFKLNGNQMVGRNVVGTNDFTYHMTLSAELLFGPDTWEACRNWIGENVDPLPPEAART